MTAGLLASIDPYLYRHRVREVMTPEPVIVPADTPLHEAIAEMMARNISSVLVRPHDGAQATGIVTARDALRAIAQDGATALGHACGDVMSSPLFTICDEDFLHVAIGRMTRLGLSHLVVSNDDELICGIVTSRALVKHRTVHAIVIGDELRAAATGADLKAAHDKLVALAQGLLADQVAASNIAAIVAGIYRDLTRRAMELAEVEFGHVLPRYALLVLGSAGRGETLLAGDQDNAIVVEDGADKGALMDTAKRATDLLDAAGLPYCQGGVMASREPWCRSLSEWRSVVEGWSRRGDGSSLLNVDIFFDLVRVHGDRELVDDLRAHALREAARPMLPRMMAAEIMDYRPPLDLLGRFRTQDGRLDLKLNGLFPIVAGARAMALRHGVEALGTRARLAAVAELGLMGSGDLERFSSAQELFLELILRQQLDDIAAGRTPGSRIDVSVLQRSVRRRLKSSLRDIGHLPQLVLDVAAHG